MEGCWAVCAEDDAVGVAEDAREMSHGGGDWESNQAGEAGFRGRSTPSSERLAMHQY